MGISMAWWKHNHNTHHIVCNSVEHDPDIQHMPLMATNPLSIDRPYWSTFYCKWVLLNNIARFFVRFQVLLFYPIMMVARFNLYANSWLHVLSRTKPVSYRYLEICTLSFYAMWVFGVAYSMETCAKGLAWLFLAHAVAGILHVQIVVSHWSMHTYRGHALNDESDEWYLTQLRTTMNIDTYPALDFIHIGLQFQIEHHLYPRVPRHNLREVRELVRAVCKKHGISYHEPGFFRSNYETLVALYQTSKAAHQAKLVIGGFYHSPIYDGLNLVG